MNELKLVGVFASCDDFYKELEKFLSDKGIVDDPLLKNVVVKLQDFSTYSGFQRSIVQFLVQDAFYTTKKQDKKKELYVCTTL